LSVDDALGVAAVVKNLEVSGRGRTHSNSSGVGGGSRGSSRGKKRSQSFGVQFSDF
jgi:hypothetical protein